MRRVLLIRVDRTRPVWHTSPAECSGAIDMASSAASMLSSRAWLASMLLQLLMPVAIGASRVKVVTVRTAQQLKLAMDGGSKHVHIVDHLDLRNLRAASPDACGGSCAARDPSRGSQSAASSNSQLYPGLFLGPEIHTLTVRPASTPSSK